MPKESLRGCWQGAFSEADGGGQLRARLDDRGGAGAIELGPVADPPQYADAGQPVGPRALDVVAAVADHHRVGAWRESEPGERPGDRLRLGLGDRLQVRALDHPQVRRQAEPVTERERERARLAR